mmetsp:Transcript_14954/g.34067  ORF Transcript_14954/g.34067 Transcript_14954/m.34067 type:complete len:512 (+) Transcript_14954:113-1648(+)
MASAPEKEQAATIERVSGGTYYQILGVTPAASSDDIKNQYRKLALKLHPDKNREDPQATERFQELQEAYEVLSDTDRRTAYDQNSDFILRAFAEGGGDGKGESFLSVPSSRTFWCLMVEAALADDGKSITAYASQLEEEIAEELLNGGVCGFTILHFAAFAGKYRAVQALIELGANVNAKTQPLCVTPSQQFCRPTPLDLTVFITNKRAKEMTMKTLQAADATVGGVDMTRLEPLWQGIIRHQLQLIKEEVLKFTKRIQTNVRRVLRNEPRWRQAIQFPGEDARSIESRRTRRNVQVLLYRFLWVLIDDQNSSVQRRACVAAWNALLFCLSWWMFSFDVFQILQTVLVALVVMGASAPLRYVNWQEVWQGLPTKEAVQEKLPTREQVEEWQQLAKAKAEWAWGIAQPWLEFGKEEFGKARSAGLGPYFEDARERFEAWREARAETGQADSDFEGEDGEPSAPSQPRKRPAGISKLIAERAAGSAGAAGSATGPTAASDAARRQRGRRRPAK